MRKRKKIKKDKLTRDRLLINKALGVYMKNLKGPERLLAAMKYAVFSGGKRLRPILAMESSRALGGKIKKTLPFACAIEFAHSFSLVHDDLPAMDDDDLRRGKPSCHKKFGESLAILAGDGLLNLAFGIIAKASRKEAPEIARRLSKAIGCANMIGGQALEMIARKRPGKNSALKKEIDRMKTAALMASSCEIGAFAAGATSREAGRFYKFGENLGRAFQISDDIEDFTREKPVLKTMRKEAELFVSRAKKNLAYLGRRAGTLNHIADIIMKKAEKSPEKR